MSLYPIIWAAEHAPVKDAEERAILIALVMKGDFDGRNCHRSYTTLARIARTDPKTAGRKCRAMAERGVLRRQTGRMPDSWKKLPKDKKTVVWEAMIPASFWSAVQLEEINETRTSRGLAPITPKNRPDLAEAPPKKARSDKGKARPERRKKKVEEPESEQERGDSQSPRSEGGHEGSGGTLSPLAGGLSVPSRGDSQSHNPSPLPSASPSSPPAPPEPVDADHGSQEGDRSGREDETSSDQEGRGDSVASAPEATATAENDTTEAPSDTEHRLERAQMLVEHAVRLWHGDHKAPNGRDRQRLIERVAAELETGGNEMVIIYEISRDLHPSKAGNAVSVVLGSRTKVPGWGRAQDPRPEHSRHRVRTKTPWCGECVERTRLIQVQDAATGQVRPSRCRNPVHDHEGRVVACHPLAYPRTAPEPEKTEDPQEWSDEEVAEKIAASLEQAAQRASTDAQNRTEDTPNPGRDQFATVKRALVEIGAAAAREEAARAQNGGRR